MGRSIETIEYYGTTFHKNELVIVYDDNGDYIGRIISIYKNKDLPASIFVKGEYQIKNGRVIECEKELGVPINRILKSQPYINDEIMEHQRQINKLKDILNKMD